MPLSEVVLAQTRLGEHGTLTIQSTIRLADAFVLGLQLQRQCDIFWLIERC